MSVKYRFFKIKVPNLELKYNPLKLFYPYGGLLRLGLKIINEWIDYEINLFHMSICNIINNFCIVQYTLPINTHTYIHTNA